MGDGLDNHTIAKAYARWAPVYDLVFGAVFERGRMAAIAAAEKDLGQGGRILVRKSGTEPLIRVMAEGDDSELVRTVVDRIIEAIPRQAA